MHPNFSQLTPRWFKRAFVYTGNIDDFRYRFEMDKDNGLLHTAVGVQLSLIHISEPTRP